MTSSSTLEMPLSGDGLDAASPARPRESTLLETPPYAPRDDQALTAELAELTRWHRAGCLPYAAMWPEWNGAERAEDIPWVHAGAFKHLDLRTVGVRHGRVLASSATSGVSSMVPLDEVSSELQARSSRAILADWVGADPRPLLVLDDPRALRRRDALSARLAAAMALKPLASDLRFLLSDVEDPRSVRWDAVGQALEHASDILVYGFTSILWLAWGQADMPPSIAHALAETRVCFIHSGGWKKLEALAVDRATFDSALLSRVAPGSMVLDCYGLVEQVGVLFPLCEYGVRHAPRWAEVVARDPWTLAALPAGEIGMLELLNVLPRGGPYHAVLTEDLGRVHAGECACGRAGRQFDLLGRVPRAELRGCANV